MQLDLTTPAVFFPAISLLMLAYTNRYLALATLIRKLIDEYETHPDQLHLIKQITLLRRRISDIKYMQSTGMFALLLCVCTMLALFLNQPAVAQVLFGVALLLMIVSLLLSTREIGQSANALDLELAELLSHTKTKDV